jgi:hypothetical protein
MADTTLSFNVLARDNASRTITKVGKSFGGLHASVGKVTKGLGFLGPAIAGIGAGAAATALIDMAKGAMEDEAAQKTLATQLKNSAKATDAQVTAVEDYISATGKAKGITDDEMRPALANLVRATNDVGEAQSLMNLAMDVSRGTGKDLGAVSIALAKAQNGNVGALGKLGIATKDANGKTLSFEQITAKLATTFKGQANVHANTLAGKMDRLKLVFDETKESIGAKLLPIAEKFGTWMLTKGIPAIERFIQNMKDGKGAGGELAQTLRDTTSAIGAIAGAADKSHGFMSRHQKIMDAIRFVLNKVPFSYGQIKSAILGAKFVIEGGTAAFDGLKSAVSSVVTWFKNLDSTGKNLVDGLKRGVVGALKGIGPWFKRTLVDPIVNWVKASFGIRSPSTVFAGIGSMLMAGLKTGLVRGLVAVAKWVGGLRTSVLRNIGDTSRTLYSRGTGFLSGLLSGLSDRWRSVTRWIGGLRASASAWLGDTSRTLYSRGSGFLQGLWAGLIDKWQSVTKWISGLKASVSAWIGDTSKFLYGRGSAVLSGFLSGMSNKWQEVTKWVSGIATWIKNNKGPVSLDGRLLIPAGQAIMSGFLKGLKSGAGPAWDFVKGVGGKSVDMLRSVFGGNEAIIPGDVGVLTGPNRRVFYQGEALDLSTYRKIKQAEARLGEALNITQGSYERRSSFSGSTHTGGGVFDVVGGNLTRINSILRGLGFASWVRQPWQGPWPAHVHAIERGNTRASDSAKAQVADFLRGGDGLAGYKQGTPWVPNDQLAFLHKGEAVLPAEVNKARMNGGGGDTHYHITVNGALDPIRTAQQIRQMLLKLKNTNRSNLGLA